MNKFIKTEKEIQSLRRGGRILAQVLQEVARAVKPGVVSIDLNNLAEDRLRALGARPSFLHYQSEDLIYPASLCVSVNSEVVHGLPNQEKILKEGDIVSLDLGCWYEGVCTDHAITISVGQASPLAKKLIKITKTALAEALKKVKANAFTGDIGEAVQVYVEAQGFSVVRQLTGHGVGRAVHEPPSVPNFGQAGTGTKLLAGMVLAIEPMVNAGGYEVKTLADGWTVVTVDNSLSAHFEHTVLVTNQGYEILTGI